MNPNLEILKNQISHIQNETMEIKTKIAQNQANANVSENFNADKIFSMMNNFSLELKNMRNEFDQKFDKVNLINSIQGSAAIKSQENVGFTTSDLLLTIIITCLVIFGFVFMYAKFKKLFAKYDKENYTVRARSTNTINTSIEMPFDNCT